MQSRYAFLKREMNSQYLTSWEILVCQRTDKRNNHLMIQFLMVHMISCKKQNMSRPYSVLRRIPNQFIQFSIHFFLTLKSKIQFFRQAKRLAFFSWHYWLLHFSNWLIFLSNFVAYSSVHCLESLLFDLFINELSIFFLIAFQQKTNLDSWKTYFFFILSNKLWETLLDILIWSIFFSWMYGIKNRM